MFDLIKRGNKAPNIRATGLGVLIACLRRLIPTFGRRVSAGGTLEHLASLPLTAQSSLALVRLHKETLLLGITPQSITLLTKGQEKEPGQLTLPESFLPCEESSSR
jgi:flagellar biogenesis protein FliO